RGSRSRRTRPTGAGPDEWDPQPLGAEIGRLLSDRGWEDTVRTAGVLHRWDAFAGPELAAHCQPESLVDGELVLVAESTAWATQVRLLAPQLLARLADQLGAGVVRRVKVHGPTAPSWSRGPRRVAGRGPRDTYG
ncbi:MAG: DciA family protein, partial [Actinomycetota bacterium]|nr:DciA family protein [Actinomycetota bacterium]